MLFMPKIATPSITPAFPKSPERRRTPHAAYGREDCLADSTSYLLHCRPQQSCLLLRQDCTAVWGSLSAPLEQILPPVGAALGDVTNCAPRTKGGVLPTEAGKPWPEQKQCTCVAQGARALTHRPVAAAHLSIDAVNCYVPPQLWCPTFRRRVD